MQSKEFHQKIEEYILSLTREEIIDFVNNIIRKIPDNKFEEVLCITNNFISNISEDELKLKINEYKKQFKKIEEGELTFYAHQYEDYSTGWDNWEIEYTDNDNLGNLITDAVKYAINLVNYKKYHYAKEILDLVLKTNYQAFDEDMGEVFEISLLDICEFNLISINITKICLYIIYVTYQISQNKVKDIYYYFKHDPNFIDISIENSFKLGIEKLQDLETFFNEWIEHLSKLEGDVEHRLLKEALIYTNFKSYKNYINEFTQNHPEIYIDIFDYLLSEDKKNEIIDLGNTVLKDIDKNSKAGSDISLYLANIDIANKEKYICESFIFKPNVVNLLRIINNGYYEKHQITIKNMLVHNNVKKGIITEETYFYLQFFSGNFEEFYSECTKHKETLGWSYSFIKTSVYLWLLLLNETTDETISYSTLLHNVFSDIGYNDKNNLFLENDINQVWKNWKSNFKIDDNLKSKVIEWLEKLIEKRVDAIIEGNHRKSYHKAALLVIGYNEMILSQNMEHKQDFVRYFIDKYPRRSAFRYELNELL